MKATLYKQNGCYLREMEYNDISPEECAQRVLNQYFGYAGKPHVFGLTHLGNNVFRETYNQMKIVVS